MAPQRRDFDEDDYSSDDRDRRDDYYDREPPRRRRDEDDRPLRRAYGDEEDFDSRPPRYDDGPRCPRCGSTARPYSRTQISPAGWVTFVLLFLLCGPLGLLGLLMTEEIRECADCGLRL